MFPSNHRSNGGGAYLALDSSLLLVGCEDDAHEGRGLIRKPKPAVLVVDKDGDDIDRLVRVSLVVGQRKAHNSLDALDPRCRSSSSSGPFSISANTAHRSGGAAVNCWSFMSL